MAWFKAYSTLARHPKTLKLSRLLRVDRRYAVGLLHDLFTWGTSAADKNGVLVGLVAEDIWSALDFPPKKGAEVVAALVEVGYLDETGDGYAIHNWYDYNGKYSEDREKGRDRVRRYRNKQETDV